MQDVPGHPESIPQGRRWPAYRWTRVLLTLLAAAGLATAAFVEWIRSIAHLGIELNIKMLWDPNVEPKALTGGGIDSVGFVALLLGAVAIIGLWPRVGWLTWVAGALAVAEATLFVVTAARASGYEEAGDMTVGDLRVGVWALVAGGVLSFIAGFLGKRDREPRVATP